MFTKNVNSHYSMSDYLRDAIQSKELSTYMENVDRFFVEQDTLCIAVAEIKGAHVSHLSDALKIISNATLGWHKPFETLKISEFTESREAGATFTHAMGVATVHRTMRVLENEHLIYKFSRGLGYPLYYGLNLGEIFNRITNLCTRVLPTNDKMRYRLNTLKKLGESPFLKHLDALMQCLDNQEFKSLADLESFFTTHIGERMSILITNVTRAKQYARRISESKEQALADQPFFKDDGTPNPRAALAYWHKEIKDSELYPGYMSQISAKLIGQMKHYLSECHADDIAEAAIRSNFHEFVIRWNYISDERRIITAISKNGRPYKVQIPGYPDFNFFYANRNAVTHILMITSVPFSE